MRTGTAGFDYRLSGALAAQSRAPAGTLILPALSGAESAFIEAIAADPNYLPAHMGLTDVYLYWPQYWEQALTSAQLTAELAPEDPAVLAYLAWAQQGAHLFDDAWATVLKAVELDPQNVIAQTAAADILSSVYQMDDSYKHTNHGRIGRSVGRGLGHAVRVDRLFADEYWDEAGDAYAEAVDLKPDFFAWHLLLARYELNTTGDIDVALDLINRRVRCSLIIPGLPRLMWMWPWSAMNGPRPKLVAKRFLPSINRTHSIPMPILAWPVS